MPTTLARFVVRRRRAVLVASLAFVVLAGALGGSVAESLTSGGFDDTGSESYRARHVLEQEFGARDPQIVLLVTARTGTVDDPAVADAGRALTARVATEAGVERAASYWTLGNAPPLRGDEGRQAMVLVAVRGDDDQVRDVADRISAEYTGTRGPLIVGVGGLAEIFREVGTQIQK